VALWRSIPRKSGEVLFEIIMRRYETRSTMMTSNRPLQDWGKLLGDVPSATAILDRFLHHAEVLTFSGKSYRLRKQSQASSAAEEHSNAAVAPTGSDAADPVSNQHSPRKNRKGEPHTACQP
jgi:hypothetical protein